MGSETSLLWPRSGLKFKLIAESTSPEIERFPFDQKFRDFRSETYSQTGCTFDGNFAIFRRNIGILVGSLSRASCSVHLVSDGKNSMRLQLLRLHVRKYTKLQVCLQFDSM